MLNAQKQHYRGKNKECEERETTVIHHMRPSLLLFIIPFFIAPLISDRIPARSDLPASSCHFDFRLVKVVFERPISMAERRSHFCAARGLFITPEPPGVIGTGMRPDPNGAYFQRQATGLLGGEERLRNTGGGEPRSAVEI
jgi:hypothetical protein